MSGHSKWSKIKHQKGATDVAKGKIFTKLSMGIIIAVKEGGGIADPQSNFKLRLAIEKAKSFNMPKDNIERAIEKAKGTGEGEQITQSVYEVFGAGGVGIIIQTASNNKQRTVSEIKSLLNRGSGTLAASGSVSHLFTYVGAITVPKQGKTFDEWMEVALEAGAQDIEDEGESVEIYTDHADLNKVKEKLHLLNIPLTASELIYRPNLKVPVKDESVAKSLLNLLSQIEDLEDVQKVYANYDIEDEYFK